MNHLETKIKEINLVLEEISKALDNITNENFDGVISELNMNLAKINDLKTDVKNKYNKPDLDPYENDLFKKTKQIMERFDNIISELKNEQNSIRIELSNIQNKKKLANYNR